MLGKLARDDRLRLMKFVISFAWADLRIADPERAFIEKMMRRLKLDEDESALVKKWLELPPRAEEVDPNDIPREHRRLFLDTAKEIVAVDGDISEEERENLALLEMMLD